MSASNEQVRKDPKTNKQDIIFNYSRIVLSEPMKKLINRGLNFSVLPKKLDITQVQVDFQQFKRLAIWTEFWAWEGSGGGSVNTDFQNRKIKFTKKP